VCYKKKGSSSFYSPKVIRAEVWVLEVERTKDEETGFNWLKAIGFREEPIPNTFPLDVGPIKRITNLEATLHFLEEKGYLKIISNPVLITLEGKTSNFISGGEIPILVSQALGTVSVVWKEYGVKLEFNGKIDDKGNIILKLKPEISDLDWGNALEIEGVLIPAIRKNNLDIEIKLLPGESILLGGLVKKTREKIRIGIPILSKFPIIGRLLFTREKVNEVIKDVVFIVTPNILPYERESFKIHILKGDKRETFYIPVKFYEDNPYFELSKIFDKKLGISYKWIEEGKLVEVKFGSKKGFLSIETSTIEIDDVPIKISPKVISEDKTIFVPFNFFEVIGLNAFWDSYTGDFYVLQEFKETQ